MLAYALFYCTTTRRELESKTGIPVADMRWLANAPNTLKDDKSSEMWEHMMTLLGKRLGELIAVRNVIEHKLAHIRKARIEQSAKRGLS